MKNIILAAALFFAGTSAFAALPSWVSSGKLPHSYPADTFIAAVGSGADMREAETSARKNIVEKVVSKLKERGAPIIKMDIDILLLKSFETVASHHDAAGKIFYAQGVINKNIAVMDVNDLEFALDGEIMILIKAVDVSSSDAAGKIREIDNVLSLYAKQSFLELFKSVLRGSASYEEPVSFERDKLKALKKELYREVSFYAPQTDFDFSKIRDFCSSNSIKFLLSLPERAQNGVMSINASLRFLKPFSEGASGFKCDWIADVVIADAYNENSVLFSNTHSGQENGSSPEDADLKAKTAAEAALNEIIIKFLKTVI
ncbi:MAG: hypothetical protein LBQ47_05520 [Endomicrobium sp.]|nr:hypothetical protein [Endomicrobium sp.]